MVAALLVVVTEGDVATTVTAGDLLLNLRIKTILIKDMI